MKAIEVNDVKKKFKVYFDKGQSMKERILFRGRNRFEERWVLNGVSFSVEKGEAVGLIGQNGCGKSTMLKLLTRIMYPDTGTIKMNGRISSLIELGAGFHPDMSGRENIYTNASIFGLTRREIDARLQAIIDFSELEEFIDNPVRTYSSGMYMRLAFAVAINVDADILLIDEILAVGDANFQAKCFNKLQEIKAQGTTVVIVSHDMSSIERLCDRVVWIKEGHIAGEGRPREIGRDYIDWVMNKRKGGFSAEGAVEQEHAQQEIVSSDQQEDTSPREATVSIEEGPFLSLSSKAKRLGNGGVAITKVALYNTTRKEQGDTVKFETRDEARLHVEYTRNDPQIKTGIFSILITRNDGLACFGTNTYVLDGVLLDIQDAGKIDFFFSPIQLLSGKYSIDFAYHDSSGKIYQQLSNAIEFEVYSLSAHVGVTNIQVSYQI